MGFGLFYFCNADMNLQLLSCCRNYNIDGFCVAESGHVTALEVILSAKVPIVKVTDIGTGVECDLSVENRDGIAKSHFIRAISAIDGRFQKLCLLVIMILLRFWCYFSKVQRQYVYTVLNAITDNFCGVWVNILFNTNLKREKETDGKPVVILKLW